MSKTTEQLAAQAGLYYSELSQSFIGTKASMEDFRQLCIAEARAELLDVAREPVAWVNKQPPHSESILRFKSMHAESYEPLYSAPINATAMRLLGQRDGLEAAIQAAMLEKVSDTGEESDEAYNAAIDHAVEAIRSLINKEQS